ncbi:PucR family transcriptional regulator, partial [Streptomyces sp. NPDC059233]
MSRSDDVLRLHRLAHTGGSAGLLAWLTTRLGGWVGVVDAERAHGSGSGLAAGVGRAAGVGQAPAPATDRASATGHAPDHAPTTGHALEAGRAPGAAQVPASALRGAAEMGARGLRSAVLEGEGSATLLFALDDRRALAAVLPLPHPPEAATLLADAAVPLALVLGAEEGARREERARIAESRAREAVLHLLMNGRLSIARQIAEALGPSLPDPMRMYVVECRTGQRGEVARLCAELTGGRAWTVRCPVYVRHLIVLVPTGPAAADDDPLAGALVGVARDAVVGVSAEAALREAPAAYTQAFHALAVARGRRERHARFGPGPELALAAHAAGAGWAGDLLAPLHGHEPKRAQDPGAQELRATAHAWLNSTSHATR